VASVSSTVGAGSPSPSAFGPEGGFMLAIGRGARSLREPFEKVLPAPMPAPAADRHHPGSPSQG
jgi:hypothetical protein